MDEETFFSRETEPKDVNKGSLVSSYSGWRSKVGRMKRDSFRVDSTEGEVTVPLQCG